MSSTPRVILKTAVCAGILVGLVAPAAAAQAEPSPAEIQRQITKFSNDLEHVVEQYNKVNEQLKESAAAADAHAVELDKLGAQVGDIRAEIGEIAATAYKRGALSDVDALLDGSQDTFVDRLGTLSTLARKRQEQIATYEAARSGQEAEQQRLDAVRAKQARQIKELAERKAGIQRDLDKLYAMRRAAYGSETAKSTGAYTGKVPAIAGSAGVAVSFAYAQIGKPYEWAADGPGSYDCSGLTLAAWRKAGKSLPHNAAMQWGKVAHISRSQLKPGDLVFYNGLGHVALYVGGGKVIHAPTFGEHVKIASYDMTSPYGYGRVR